MSIGQITEVDEPKPEQIRNPIGLHRGYLGIMEKKMETIVYWRLYWDNGKEHGNYYRILEVILG